MWPSARSVLNSLHLNVEESTALKNATREWLEQEYCKDVARIKSIKRRKLRTQSWRFLQKHGSTFFSKAGNGRLLWSTDSQKLVKKITTIMVCQVEYKQRLGRRGHEGDTISAVSIGFENDSDGSGGSNETCASKDYEYKPKNSQSGNHQNTFHYTRQNAQPGMPICHSIEKSQSGQNKRSSAGSHERARTMSDDSSGWDVSSISDMSNLTDSVQPQTIATSAIEVSNNYTQKYGPTMNEVRLINGQFVNTAMVEQRLPALPIPIDFQALGPLEIGSKIHVQTEIAGAPVISSHLDLPSTDQNTSNTLSGQQTPLESARLPTRVRKLSWIENADSDSKPHPDAPIKPLIDLTLQASNTVYLGADHFEIIQEDLGVPIVQILLDFLNDKSRQCQKLARQRKGSMIQKEIAEQKAIFMCKMLSELRNDKRIWSGTYVAETD